VTQEVLLYVAGQLPQFEHNGRTGAFRCWLKQILINRLRKFWNRRDRQPTATGDSQFLAELEQLEDPDSGLSRLWNQQHDEHVLSTLLKLVELRFEESTWRAFQMLVFEHKSPAEVGEELGLSPNAVCAAKCRVLNQLRRERRGLID
jgi:RNA polymerase sigma-70 factor (ECF subfamily)